MFTRLILQTLDVFSVQFVFFFFIYLILHNLALYNSPQVVHPPVISAALETSWFDS